MWSKESLQKVLSPKQVQKIVELRSLDEPVTIANIALRFGVSERKIYYVLAQWREAQLSVLNSMQLAKIKQDSNSV